MHASSIAQRDPARVVHLVAPDPIATDVEARASRARLLRDTESFEGGATAQGPARVDGVVCGDKAIELARSCFLVLTGWISASRGSPKNSWRAEPLHGAECYR